MFSQIYIDIYKCAYEIPISLLIMMYIGDNYFSICVDELSDLQKCPDILVSFTLQNIT